MSAVPCAGRTRPRSVFSGRPRCGRHRPLARYHQAVYDKARYYVDASAGYNLHAFNGKVRAHIQFNVRNVFERGRLQAVAVNPDGTPYAFRIIDPAQFILSTTFDL